MPSLGTLVRALRAPSLTAGAMPVLTATALVASRGVTLDWLSFALTLLGMLAAQGAVNLVNDYFDDASGLDADPEFTRNPFPLGSRVIQSGALSKRGVARFAAACGGVAVACGLWLNARAPGNTLLVICLGAAVLGYFYTAPPLRIAYHGAGEPVTFLLFGPLAGAGTEYAQTGSVTRAGLVLSCFVGLLAMDILYMHHFPQHDADKRHGKLTPVVRLGPAGAGRLVPLLVALPYAVLGAGIAGGLLPAAALLAFLSLPFGVRAARIALRTPADPKRMTQAFANVFGLHFTGGLLLAGSLLFA
ncbi:MAG TPA: prenyltransferase [Myxococcota bacterium]|nr:prenyltransferase [Myxococcota bacterium]